VASKCSPRSPGKPLKIGKLLELRSLKSAGKASDILAGAGAGAGAGAAVIKSTGYMSTRTVKDNDQTENKLVFVFNSFSKCIIHSLRHGLVLG
jgi:hypothetical protein